MKLFIEKPERDRAAEIDRAKKGYGAEHPEKTLGFVGAFLYTAMPVYLSDKAETILSCNPRIERYYYDIIRRFYAGDYGFVTKDEYDLFGENRWLGGSVDWMIGRYFIEPYGPFVFETMEDMALLYRFEEDVSDIIESQQKKRGHYNLRHPEVVYRRELFCR